jgi:N-acetylglucosaminyldiphosphoundecaprenol N-acetyl-beta-D-mannosaminyltransferase
LRIVGTVTSQPDSRARPDAKARPRSHRRVTIGGLGIDAVTFDEALETIAELIERGDGGAVFTPNVDHVVKAEANHAFRAAYARASLSLPDGMPVVWASRVVGPRLPEKVSGSDLIVPVAKMAAERNWGVYLLGADDEVGSAAAARLSRELGVRIVGRDSPVIDEEGRMREDGVLERLRAANADLVLVAFGAPKQELWIDRFRVELAPAVAIGVGGSLDIVAGRVRRAPTWMSRMGLEWLFRLAQEPRRLWRRYLIDDPKFVAIVARSRRDARRRAQACGPP